MITHPPGHSMCIYTPPPYYPHWGSLQVSLQIHSPGKVMKIPSNPQIKWSLIFKGFV